MKPILHLSLLIATLALPMAEVAAQSQSEMNQEAHAGFEKADAELNKVYAKVLAKLDAEGQRKLKAAQRTWVAFRDAQAELDADIMRGGSAAPMLHSGSMAGSTQTRTQQLKEFLKQLSEP